MAADGEKGAPVGAQSRRSRAARDALILAHLKVMEWAARRWSFYLNLDHHEARGICGLALVEAAASWPNDGGGKFSSWCTRAMFFALCAYLRAQHKERLGGRQRPIGDFNRRADKKARKPYERAVTRDLAARALELARGLDKRLPTLLLALEEGRASAAAAVGMTRQGAWALLRRHLPKLRALLRGPHDDES